MGSGFESRYSRDMTLEPMAVELELRWADCRPDTGKRFSICGVPVSHCSIIRFAELGPRSMADGEGDNCAA